MDDNNRSLSTTDYGLGTSECSINLQILSIPAALEMDLRPHASSTIEVIHVILLWTRLLINAQERHTVRNRSSRIRRVTIGICGVVVASCRLVSTQYLEIRREGNGVVLVRTATEVVDDSTAVRYLKEGPVLVAVV